MSPDRPPLTAGPNRPSGGSGGGPASGATSRKLTTPVPSLTHRSVSHQPSGASDGLAIPAWSVRDPNRTGCSRRNEGPGGGSRSGTGGGYSAPVPPLTHAQGFAAQTGVSAPLLDSVGPVPSPEEAASTS